MKFRLLIVLLLIVAVTSLNAARQVAARANLASMQAATAIPMLPGTFRPIAVGPGHETRPRVSCGFTTYTNDDLEGTLSVKYFDFASNTTYSILESSQERLSDTDGKLIAFTQLDIDGDRSYLYDISSQTTTPIPGAHNAAPAIGGNLVAFMHGSADRQPYEISVYDQNTGITTQLTNDGLFNEFPAVSPDGKVVVWTQCQTNGTGCDIYAATQTGPGVFATRRLTDAGEDRFPDTNGQLVAYISDKSGDKDIYLQRVDGGSEMHLALPGEQHDVRISGNLLVFASRIQSFSDIFLYDLSTARLYQVTSSTDHNETLSDIATGCDGFNRIVFAVEGLLGYSDVYEFSFQLNDSINDQLSDLIALVKSFKLRDGTEASLLSKLQDAQTALNASDSAIACDSLTAFINASQAQSGKKLTTSQVKQLIDSASQIKADLGCQ